MAAIENVSFIFPKESIFPTKINIYGSNQIGLRLVVRLCLVIAVASVLFL